jgi:hypothetical protein
MKEVLQVKQNKQQSTKKAPTGDKQPVKRKKPSISRAKTSPMVIPTSSTKSVKHVKASPAWPEESTGMGAPKIVKKRKISHKEKNNDEDSTENAAFYARIDRLLDQKQNVSQIPRILRPRNWTMQQWDAERERLNALPDDEGPVEDIADDKTGLDDEEEEDEDESEMADFIVD